MNTTNLIVDSRQFILTGGITGIAYVLPRTTRLSYIMLLLFAGLSSRYNAFPLEVGADERSRVVLAAPPAPFLVLFCIFLYNFDLRYKPKTGAKKIEQIIIELNKLN